MITIFLSVFLIAAWLGGEGDIDENHPLFEKTLRDAGLRPIDPENAAALLADNTVYATYALTRQKRIDFFDAGGVVVQSPERDDLTGGRALLFGSWWGDGDNTCFAFGSSGNIECYRLYYREGRLLYIQARSNHLVPAGALQAYSTEIRRGNSEDFPMIGF